MGEKQEIYQDPLVSRYTSERMQRLFSEEFKSREWRRWWIALAEAQREVGLERITQSMINEMINAQAEPINYVEIASLEKKLRHDVMAHIREFGSHCPTAAGIVHLAETSQYVGCNTDLVQMRRGLQILKPGVVNTISNLARFARQHKDLMTLAYTHIQPGQPTTVGKRACMYIQDLLMDLEEFEHVESLFKARGAKGTTGTQAAMLALFDGDYEKVKAVDALVAKKMKFDLTYPITGQTYTRKFDTLVASALAGIGSSATKFSWDVRILATLKCLEEPFEAEQVGSSAMAYKRNPMRSERMTALSRKLIGLVADFYHTHANQVLERTLDDSAIRRMDIPQGFLLTEAILKIWQNVSGGMVVYPAMIRRHLDAELPFMATEEILMEACKRGKDRQTIHERIRVHSVAAGKKVKEEGKDNDLINRVADDPEIGLTKANLEVILARSELFIGAAPMQTEEFLEE
ncbi:MAG TPA: adenylosuccinate lyase, partial [Candidatus Nanoarchaeia archaeon]|nr:adenylosuccinate lyase [Candidatus Nanoarchaeia archaeon]